LAASSNWIARAERGLARIEAVVMVVVAALMLTIMLVVVADVFMRYVVNRPFSFTYDLVGLYLLAGLFFLSLSDTFRVRGHVNVDILVQHLGPVGRRWSEIVACLAGLPVFSAIAWLGWERAWDNWVSNDVLAGAISWPTWASAVLVPIGCGLLVLRLLLHLAGHVASLVTGRNITPLPAGHGEQRLGFE
jgi:TRAP-type C4-dicarboxylate transport system permease small subunit